MLNKSNARCRWRCRHLIGIDECRPIYKQLVFRNAMLISCRSRSEAKCTRTEENRTNDLRERPNWFSLSLTHTNSIESALSEERERKPSTNIFRRRSTSNWSECICVFVRVERWIVCTVYLLSAIITNGLCGWGLMMLSASWQLHNPQSDCDRRSFGLLGDRYTFVQFSVVQFQQSACFIVPWPIFFSLNFWSGVRSTFTFPAALCMFCHS